MRLVIFTFTLALTGCTTVEFVRKETTPKKLGVLRYLPTSSASKQAKYKDEVDKKAREFCAGDFEITREYQAREASGTSTGVGVGTGFGFGMGGVMLGGSSANTEMYNFVEFACK